MDKLYSLKDIRVILESEGRPIPDGTLRNYRDTFLDLLVFQGKGRFSRYHEESIGIFRRIRELRIDEHLDNNEIRARLVREFQCETLESPEGRNNDGLYQSGATAHAADPAPDSQLSRLAGQVQEIHEKTMSMHDTNEQILQYLKEKLHRSEELTGLMKRNLELRMSELQTAILDLRRDIETMKTAGGAPGGLMVGTRHLGQAATTGDYEEENYPGDKPRSFFDRIMKL